MVDKEIVQRELDQIATYKEVMILKNDE